MGRSAVVVAHPDDEILWLSAALAAARPAVLCFGAPFGRPGMAAARARAVAELGLPQLVDLAIPEAGMRRPADAAAQLRHETNSGRLVAALRPLLRGVADVHTHNPWGEYGHPEHVQVHRAVRALQAELGFTLWFSNYVAPASFDRALALADAPCWTRASTVTPDIGLAHHLRRIYLRHGAWTFSRLHRWPAEETYYGCPAEAGAQARGLRGEWLLDVSALRFWRAGRAALRRLG